MLGILFLLLSFAVYGDCMYMWKGIANKKEENSPISIPYFWGYCMLLFLAITVTVFFPLVTFLDARNTALFLIISMFAGAGAVWFQYYRYKEYLDKNDKTDAVNPVQPPELVWSLKDFKNMYGDIQFRESTGDFMFGGKVIVYPAKELKNYTLEHYKEVVDRLKIKLLPSGRYCMYLEWENVDLGIE